ADSSIGTGKVYTGSKRVPFTISPAVNTWISDPTIEGWIYGDTPNAPTGSVKFGEIDYKYYSDANCQNLISDINAVNVGKYYVEVFAQESSNYTGPISVILSFTISPNDISEASVSIARNEYPYNNGSPIEIDKSSITVTIGSGESAYNLDQDDFTIASYDPAGHSEPGVVTVTVAGAGNYKGTATVTFTIYREYQVKFLSIGQVVELKSVREGSTVSDPGEPAIRPASENYRFDGWYIDYLYTEKFDFTQPITEDVSPTANWIRYSNVTFDTGDPDVVIDGENPQKVDWGNYVVRPEDPVRPGYKFVAWCDDNGEYKFNLKIYGDVTLTAQWIPEYTVSFFTGEGTAIDSQPVVEDGFVEVPALPPEWEGHDFKGWYKDEECTTEYDFTEPVKNSFTLYAKWEDIPPEGG
ncbi:MAG: InlB B-repeat-containing protein, partial [Oscillospiraceae bacterium]|nr:InlB B-repeat-containing protein [Oscillospiraceae bacterium]